MSVQLHREHWYSSFWANQVMKKKTENFKNFHGPMIYFFSKLQIFEIAQISAYSSASPWIFELLESLLSCFFLKKNKIISKFYQKENNLSESAQHENLTLLPHKRKIKYIFI
jgi:hypothetical protein